MDETLGEIAKIGECAFSSTNIQSIIIPKSVENIGDGAFDRCTNLKQITCKGMNPPICGKDVFYGISRGACEIIVPVGSLSAYQSTSPWNEFYRIREEGSEYEETSDDCRFLWHNPEGLNEYRTEVGYIEQKYGSSNLVNYLCYGLDNSYRSICLMGSYLNIQLGLTDRRDETSYMELVLSGPLEEGDIIKMTAFRNDFDNAAANAILLLNSGKNVIIGGENGLGFVNLNHVAGTQDATEPNELTHTITAEEAGATIIYLTRYNHMTPLYITKLEITKSNDSAITEITFDELQEKTVNLEGRVVGQDYKGIIIRDCRLIPRV